MWPGVRSARWLHVSQKKRTTAKYRNLSLARESTISKEFYLLLWGSRQQQDVTSLTGCSAYKLLGMNMSNQGWPVTTRYVLKPATTSMMLLSVSLLMSGCTEFGQISSFTIFARVSLLLRVIRC
jgi:hypothetical protein